MQPGEEAENNFPSLLRPITVGERTLKNRIVFPPITTGLAGEDGTVTEEMCTFYASRAEGGPAAIIVEAAAVSPGGKLALFSAGAWSDDHVTGLEKLAKRIKEKETLPYLQLAHGGARAAGLSADEQPIAPSAVTLKKAAPVPRIMSREEIGVVVENFIRGAERAHLAGFEGVELHGAHFYLLSSFLSPVTNKREDEYGGDVEGRTRLVREIIAGIKAQRGSSFAVICRFNGSELHEEGIDAEEAAIIAQQLEKAGADAVHVSGYTIYVEALKRFARVPALAVPRKDDPSGIFVPPAEKIKKAVRIPVICVGKINRGDLAEEILSGGKADLVAVGRPLLADSQFWPRQLKGQKVRECRYCLYCLKAIRKGKIACRVNKELL